MEPRVSQPTRRHAQDSLSPRQGRDRVMTTFSLLCWWSVLVGLCLPTPGDVLRTLVVVGVLSTAAKLGSLLSG